MLIAAAESSSTTETSNEYFFQENAKQIASLLNVVIAVSKLKLCSNIAKIRPQSLQILKHYLQQKHNKTHIILIQYKKTITTY